MLVPNDYIVPMLVSPSRQHRYPIDIWWGLSMEESEQGEGVASITWAMDITNLPQGFLDNPYAYSIDGFWCLGATNEVITTPIWSGCITRFDDEFDFATGLVIRKIDLETFTHHIPRRRLAVRADHVPWVETSSVPTPTTWLKFGETILATADTKPTAPTGRMNAYPASVRSDWYSAWTVSFETPINDGGAAVHKKTFESGNNMWDLLLEVCEMGDLGVECTETSAATWHFNLAYPYQRNDLTGEGGVVISDLIADRITRFRRSVDYTSIANVFFARGDGQQSTTDPQWVQIYANTTSIAKYGIFEDGSTTVGMTNGASLSEHAKSWTLDRRRGEPRTSYTVGLSGNLPGRIFGVDWGRRDLVRLHHSTMLPDHEDLVVREWSLSQQGPGQQPDLQLVLGDSRYGWLAEDHLRNFAGGTAGRYGGGLIVSKAG